MALALNATGLAAFARSHPFFVGASAATLKAATADCMIQTCVEGRSEIDVKRVAVFTTFCFGFTGCWQYYLYRVILRSGGPLWLILAGGRRETSHSVRGLLGRPKGPFRHTITHLQLH